MKSYKVGLVNLGCDKNRIDSEIMLNKLIEAGYKIENDPNMADIIIINTCAFINDAKQESINTILEMSLYKNKQCKCIVATGCLTQRYKEQLKELIPEIDIMLGVNDYDKLISSIEDFLQNHKKINYCNCDNSNVNSGLRILTTNKYTAYLRIAEGCSNNCSYCIIPKIRGKFRSRSFDDIIKEANILSENGVKEIILVAQDTTQYGIDLYGKKMLPDLLRELSKIKKIKWIRLLYCYPEEITDDLIVEIANNPKVCKYIDMPIQHVNNEILRKMRRKTNKETINKVINKLRHSIPNICIRTSIMVGFPGETQEHFNELKQFINEVKFNKLGVFKYSQEENTPAALMKDQIDERIKQQRYDELMMLQQKVSYNLNKLKIGNVYEVLVEDYKDGYWYGRNYEMSPEIDGLVMFKCDKIINIGEFVNVKIIKSLEYDLIGVV